MKRPDVLRLLAELKALRESCLAMEAEFAGSIAEACPQSQPSARNLVDYLALRQHDLRDLQARLAALGISSLGRSESSTLAAVEAVIAILELLAGEAGSPRTAGVDFETGPALLAQQAEQLLGPVPQGREVRVMVTMPSEAAQSYEQVKQLIEAGMDVMRVNCAHDEEAGWAAMIGRMRQGNRELGRHCRVLMDLGGPKLRTGPISRGHQVVHWKIEKDVLGAPVAPARVALVFQEGALEADARIPVPEALLRPARPGDVVRFKDSRGKKRELVVTARFEGACLCTCEQSGYVVAGAKLKLVRDGKVIANGHVGELPFVEEPIRLHSGDVLTLTKESRDAALSIACTLPEVFVTAQAGQAIFFDDGKIEGRILELDPNRMQVEILHAGERGTKLGSAKGINLPDTELGVGAMTEQDRRDLDFIAKHADIVGLSFVRRPEDVLELQRELAARGRSDLGIVLKIESRSGFDQLPLIMMAAQRHHPVGIMVARGDLAVEVGFERLAELQEEILWLSEAAHMPMIWATQVLENLAKTGIPSRAEVTDAAMGVRAECVMLNKGAHIQDAVRFLDRVLKRMENHHSKKRSMLRRLAVAQVKQGGDYRGSVDPNASSSYVE